MNYKAILISVVTISACLAQDSKEPPPPPLEIQLLQEAYGISVNFAPEERADILLRLTQASGALEANPGKMAYSATGFEQIMDLAETAASRPGSSYDLLSRIRQVRSELIRANLLSSMAKGLFETAPSRGA